MTKREMSKAWGTKNVERLAGCAAFKAKKARRKMASKSRARNRA